MHAKTVGVAGKPVDCNRIVKILWGVVSSIGAECLEDDTISIRTREFGFAASSLLQCDKHIPTERECYLRATRTVVWMNWRDDGISILSPVHEGCCGFIGR